MIIHILLGINSIWGFCVGLDLIKEDLKLYSSKFGIRHVVYIALWTFFGVWGILAISWVFVLVVATINEPIRIFKKLVGKK